jgi:hypothetical protein
MPHVSDSHSEHDPLLVAAFAAGDLTAKDRDAAAMVVSDCPDCRELHADLAAIARATATLPAAPRSRDFRLSAADAARLRPAGWRRFAAGLASPRLAFTRQLGVGLTTLGIAGLLFTVLPGVSVSMGGAAGASAAPSSAPMQALEPRTEAAGAGASPAASAGAAAAPDQVSADSSARMSAGGQIQASPAPASGSRDRSSDDQFQSYSPYLAATTPIAPDIPPLLVASLLAIVVGLALLIARRLARRFAGR